MGARKYIQPKHICSYLCTNFYFRLFVVLVITFYVIQTANSTKKSPSVLVLSQVTEELSRLHTLQAKQLEGHDSWMAEQAQLKGVIEEQRAKLNSLSEQQRRQLDDLKEVLENKHKLRLPLRPNYVAPHDPSNFKPDTFEQFGTHGFIRFSAYRTSAQQIVALGLAALALEKTRQLGGCFWHSEEGGREKIPGALTFHSTIEHHSSQYDVVRVQCDLSAPTPQGGGWLTGDIDLEGVLLYRESGQYIVAPPQPWQSKVTYCSSPLFGTMSTRRVWEWFEYHRVVVGMDRAVLYNVGAVTDPLRAALKDYYEAGWVEEVEFAEAQSYQTWLYCRLLAASDCAYRTRLTSKWVFMADMDEYIVPRAPETMGSLLRKYPEAAYLTHSQTVGGDEMCVEGGGEGAFTLERLIFRWPGLYCAMVDESKFRDRNYCLDHYGHRKYFLNPRKVRGVTINRAFDSGPGVDLSTSAELTHFHFAGLMTANGSTHKIGLCGNVVAEDFVDPWWVKDTVLADMVAVIKSCAFHNRTCVEQIE